MKIGIMTFWWSQDNYGQLLQCYALQQYMRDLGHDAFVIRFRMPDTQWNWRQKFVKYGLHPWRVLQGIRQVKARAKGRAENLSAGRDFNGFRSKYVKFTERVYGSLRELRENPPNADLYLVGSDQVWNSCGGTIAKDSFRAYFLDFGLTTTIRASYAASWGRSFVSKAEMHQLLPLLQKFKSVSVREKSGIEICRSYGVNAEWVCDPTLLVDRPKYTAIADVSLNKARDYVFAYVLANDCNFSYAELMKWASAHELDLIYVKGNSGQIVHFEDEEAEFSYPTIPQWLGLISGAKYVVTNSFHCCIFSMIFGRRFGVLPLTGQFKSTNNRIPDLCELTGNRMNEIVENNYDILQCIDPPVLDIRATTAGRCFLERLISK